MCIIIIRVAAYNGPVYRWLESSAVREGSGKEEKPDADFQGAGGNWPEGLRRDERKSKRERIIRTRSPGFTPRPAVDHDRLGGGSGDRDARFD